MPSKLKKSLRIEIHVFVTARIYFRVRIQSALEVASHTVILESRNRSNSVPARLSVAACQQYSLPFISYISIATRRSNQINSLQDFRTHASQVTCLSCFGFPVLAIFCLVYFSGWAFSGRDFIFTCAKTNLPDYHVSLNVTLYCKTSDCCRSNERLYWNNEHL
jgi:hypothetical protein